MPRNKINKAHFIYNQKGGEPIYVHGVYGGMTPHGELIAHFYIEYPPVPSEERVPVKDGQPDIDRSVKTYGSEIMEGEALLYRDIKASLIIPPQAIASIANWMLDKLKESGIEVVEEPPK